MTSIQRDLLSFALEFASRHKSPHTGLIHYCHEGEPHDTIPLYENFCYVLALFRTRQSANVLEAKALLTRLLNFSCHLGFPIYIHQYPKIYSQRVNQKIYVILFHIQRLFGTFIEEDLEAFLKNMPSFTPLKNESSEALSDWLLNFQMKKESPSLTELTSHYSQKLFRKTRQFQDEVRLSNHPALTLYDFFMFDFFAKMPKWIENLTPVHLEAVVIFPLKNETLSQDEEDFLSISDHSFMELTWGDESINYSFVSFEKKEGPCFVYEGGELKFYFTRFDSVEVLINGEKATFFRLKDAITIKTPLGLLMLQFDVVEGEEALFCGHLSFSNRPNQKLKKNTLEAHDYCFTIRAVQEEVNARLSLKTQWQKVQSP